jgi:hypothetical protein
LVIVVRGGLGDLGKGSPMLPLKGRDLAVIGLLGTALAWFFFRSGAGVPGMTGGVAYDEADLNAVTRLLLAETSFNRPEKEQIGVVMVAVNRARRDGSSLSTVAVPPGDPNWNASKKFRDRWEGSIDYPQFNRARDFVQSVLDGEHRNPIGDRTHFLHPRGMPRCDDGECPEGRTCVDTVAGRRCLPKWAVGSNVITVDGARFS